MANTPEKHRPYFNPAVFYHDAAAVVAMRCAKIARGGDAGWAEAKLMVTEKFAALAHVQWRVLTGAYGITPHSVAGRVAAHYARGVRANRERLARSAAN